MNKVAIVYWSGTGNTEQMAQAVAEGVKNAGGEADVLTCAEFDSAKLADYGAVAFGCPAMGAEQLEDFEFEPLFLQCAPELNGKDIALFGSYGWGDGQWMREWAERVTGEGATVVNGEGLICQETPDDAMIEECKNLGKALAANA